MCTVYHQLSYSCIMYPSDLSNMYTEALGFGYTYQANHKGTWYNWYVPCRLIAQRQLITHSNTRQTTEFIMQTNLWNLIVEQQKLCYDSFVNINGQILTVSWKFYLVTLLVFKAGALFYRLFTIITKGVNFTVKCPSWVTWKVGVSIIKLTKLLVNKL